MRPKSSCLALVASALMAVAWATPDAEARGGPGVSGGGHVFGGGRPGGGGRGHVVGRFFNPSRGLTGIGFGPGYGPSSYQGGRRSELRGLAGYGYGYGGGFGDGAFGGYPAAIHGYGVISAPGIRPPPYQPPAIYVIGDRTGSRAATARVRPAQTASAAAGTGPLILRLR